MSWLLVFLNNFSLAGKQGQLSQILYTKRAALPHQVSAAPSSSLAASSSRVQGSPENSSAPSRVAPTASSPNQSQAAVRAREFAAEIFRQSQGGGGGGGKEGEHQKESEKNIEQEGNLTKKGEEEGRPCLPQTSTPRGCVSLQQRSEEVMSPTSSSSSPSSPLTPSSTQETSPGEPGYVNYSRLHYRLQQPGAAEENTAGEKWFNQLLRREKCDALQSHVFASRPGFEDDKFQLPFTVTDLRGQNLQLVSGPHNGQVRVSAAVAAPRWDIISSKFKSDLSSLSERLCGAADFRLWIPHKRGDPKRCCLGLPVLLLQRLRRGDFRGQYTSGSLHIPSFHWHGET